MKTKIFFINFIQYIGVFLIVCFLLGYIDGMPDEGGSFNFLNGYLAASFIAVLVLGYKISLDFVKNEKIEEFRIIKNMGHKEFRDMYGDIIDALR